jgi:hypothetical protein
MSTKRYMRKSIDWRPVFLVCVREGADVKQACILAGVCREMPYKERSASPEFAQDWEAARKACEVRIKLAADRARRDTPHSV